MANEFKVKKGLVVDGTGTVLDIQGTQGQLFSVTDSLTGDLFSVSDISGVPIFNVNSSGAITADGDIYVGSDSIYDVGTSTVKFANIHADDFHGTFNGHLTGNAGSATSAGTCSGNSATVTTNANLTGHVTSVGNAAVLGSFTTAQLNAAISDGTINSQTLPTASSLGAVTTSGNQTIGGVKTFTSPIVSEIKIKDTRNSGEVTPANFTDNAVSFSFTDDFSNLGSWYSGMTMKGWSGTYAAWQLIGEADSSTGDGNLYFRNGAGSSWNSMKKVAWLNVANLFTADQTFDTTTVRINQNVNMDFGDTSLFRLTHSGSSGNMKFTNRNHGAYTYHQSENSTGTVQNLIKYGGASGEVNISYGGSYKLSTVSAGITVAGSIHSTGSIGPNFVASTSGQVMEPGDSTQATLRCDADRWRVYMGGDNGETLTVAETGRVGINDSSPDYTLDVSGNVSNISIYASHDVAAYSDARVKGDVETIPDALDKVNKLRGVTFVRTDEGSSDKRMMGVIAQEVKDIIPEVVNKRESDGHYSVSYGNIVGLLIESIKELTAEVESLKERIDGGTK